MERLQKVMAHAGVASRRKCEAFIQEGRVKVNGEIVRELGFKVGANDKIEVDGIPIYKEEPVYFMFYRCGTTRVSSGTFGLRYDRASFINQRW